MLIKKQQIQKSDFEGLYARLIPQEHLLRKLNTLVDFTFVYDELESKYCPDNGRNAESPIRMLKYLLLKTIYEMSDGDLVERSRYDMSFKYFLDYRPEDDVINPSSLSKFRKLRLNDEGLLDLLLQKSVEIALEKGVLKSPNLLIDSTHTASRYRHLSPVEVLREQAKKLRKAVYNINEQAKENMPTKPNSDDLEVMIRYAQELLEIIQKDAILMFHPAVSEKVNYLEEMVQDNCVHLKESADDEARVGHKSITKAFFGYKTHIAMTEDGIITAAKVSSGEKSDGGYLKELVEKSQQAGVKIQNIVGDGAYAIKENLDYVEGLALPESDDTKKTPEKIRLISKLLPRVCDGTRKAEDQLDFNKDAGMFVCKAGHLAISKVKRHNKQNHRKENPREVYYFDVEKCKRCPQREGCYNGTKSKSYSITLTSEVQTKQKDFQNEDMFKALSKQRYKIEAKNSELKNQHGYRKAESSGIHAMEIQGATTLFCVNLLRIVRLMGK